MKFTVLGGNGFIGAHIVREIASAGYDVFVPTRNEVLENMHLGIVIYCIGLTSNSRALPHETIEAHVTKLSDIIKKCSYDSITYASSTRVYHGLAENIVYEDSPLAIDFSDEALIFNLSKLLGEVLLIRYSNFPVRVIRFSNIYGYDFKSNNFITSILKQAVQNKKILVHTTLDSSKDYLSVQDAARITFQIALQGNGKVYNVCSGSNLTNSDILNVLYKERGIEFKVSHNATKNVFPIISNEKIVKEFNFSPKSNLLQDLPNLFDSFQSYFKI